MLTFLIITTHLISIIITHQPASQQDRKRITQTLASGWSDGGSVPVCRSSPAPSGANNNGKHYNLTVSSSLSSLLLQSPGRCEPGKEDLSITDDTSSTGNKEDDEDEDEDEGNDENFDGFSRDPERLKAFNVRTYIFGCNRIPLMVAVTYQPWLREGGF